ncbi:MAG TPA: NAD(P)-binding protein [Polyangia bacterium]|nr:NAD(P)-binding protein [Polyangia bacterium]
MKPRKRKVAILGGGMSALTTAFQLTRDKDWQQDYEITVYNMGWRLGGKGASGRNRADHNRIEEHGLHILSGFYDNTFSILRECYTELARPPGSPLATVDDAFKKHDLFVLMEKFGGRWREWIVKWPRNNQVPGVGTETPSAWHYLLRLLQFMVDTLFGSMLEAGGQLLGLGTDSTNDAVTSIRSLYASHAPTIQEHVHASELPEGGVARKAWADSLIAKTKRLFAVGTIAAEVSFLHVAFELARALPGEARHEDSATHQAIKAYLEKFRDWLRDATCRCLGDFDVLRYLWILLDLGIAAVAGMIEDGLVCPPQNWFKIDGLSLKAWLSKHGASQESVNSAPIEVLYSMCFADDVEVGAGTALHYGMCLVFDYKGAFSYKMQAGMGDCVFAPMYQVLKKRGVKFEFFKRVDRLELSPDQSVIAKIHLGTQATLNQPEYEPLFDVNGVPSWPSTPLYEQLVQGAELERGKFNLEDWWTEWRDPVPPTVLVHGRDFDDVVLGISIGAFPYIAQELMAADPRFNAMVNSVHTIQTQALQLWFTPDLEQLGWPRKPPILGTYAEPFDTWADMSQLIIRESWPPGVVNEISYLCDHLDDDRPPPPRDDHAYPHEQKARVRQNAVGWLKTNVRALWPKAAQPQDPNALDWSLLVAPEGTQGEARFDAQFWHAPVNPSERYVLSVPGSSQYRLREHQTNFCNLLLTGDWIKTPISAGFLEAATMAGLQAAAAIEGVRLEFDGNWLADEAGGYHRDLDALCRSPLLRPYQANFVPVQPYQLTDTKMYVFTLAADYAKLQSLCDRYLNLGGETQYVPAMPLLALVCVDIGCIASDDPQSWVPEKDFGFWMPVLAGKKRGGVFVPERALVYIPFLWVDSSLAVTVGREVYGYPKGIGSLSLPEKPGDPSRFTVDGWAVAKYGKPPSPDAQWKERPILVAERSGAWEPLQSMWKDLEEVAAAIGGMLGTELKRHEVTVPSRPLTRALIQDALHLRVPMVFLKQLTDVANGVRANYQSLVEANCVVDGGFKGGGLLLGDYQLTIHAYDSCRIVDQLGLFADGPAGGVQTVKSLFQFWVAFDFTLDNGAVVWKPPA